MNESEPANTDWSGKRTWRDKFQSALRGIGLGVKGPRSFESSGATTSGSSVAGKTSPNSFWVHLPLAATVIIAGLLLNVGLASMGLLILCIGLVIVAELLNTSIEFLACAITSEYDVRVKAALDVASGAVLVASLIAAIVGALVLCRGVLLLLN